MEWLRDMIKKHDLTIVLVLSFLIGLGLYIFPQSREFGVNVLTEFASVWITVFLVNRLIEKRERKRRVSIDQRILIETLSLIASYYSIWKHLVWKYFPTAKIQNEKDLIALYPELVKATQLFEKFEIVSIHYPESWKLFFHNRTIKECFENYFETMLGNVRSLIENFKIHLEPELLGYLLELTESEYFREVNAVFCNDDADVLHEFGQDTNKLSSYLTITGGHFDKIIELSAYCRHLHSRIAEFIDPNVAQYHLKDYFRNPLSAYPVTSAMPSEV